MICWRPDDGRACKEFPPAACLDGSTSRDVAFVKFGGDSELKTDHTILVVDRRVGEAQPAEPVVSLFGSGAVTRIDPVVPERHRGPFSELEADQAGRDVVHRAVKGCIVLAAGGRLDGCAEKREVAILGRRLLETLEIETKPGPHEQVLSGETATARAEWPRFVPRRRASVLVGEGLDDRDRPRNGRKRSQPSAEDVGRFLSVR